MLAALEYVDWVAINPAPDAVSAIDAIRPKVYVKGQDYQNPEGDVTGKITTERKAAEAHGGHLAFTDEVTFSSSELINRHLNVFEPHVREHLSSLRNDGGLNELLSLLDRIRDYRVVLVGDAIIDEYQYVLPMAKAPKENIIATRYQDRELFAGGVFAAANHVASFCKQVDVITSLGAQQSFETVVRDALLPNVRLHNIMRPGAPTTRKRRFVDRPICASCSKSITWTTIRCRPNFKGGSTTRSRNCRPGRTSSSPPISAMGCWVAPRSRF